MALFETPPVSTTYYLKNIVIDVVPAITSGVAPFTLGGLAQNSGAGKEELLNWKRTKETTMLESDGVGNPIFSIDPSRIGEVELSLMHTNPVNSQFQRLLTIPSLIDGAPNVGGMFNMTVRDVGNLTVPPLLTCRYCRIRSQPEGSRKVQADEHKWPILVGILICNEWGNSLDGVI